MAMMFEEDKRRLFCECGNGYIYKKEIFTYLTDTKDKDALQERLLETHLCCNKCNRVVKKILPGKVKILS
jgi:hypothetical protein